MLARIQGPESQSDLESLRDLSVCQRILPVLDSLRNPPASGLLVTNGFDPGPDRIGLNDIVLEFNSQVIRTAADLARADASTRPGDVVAVKVMRNGIVQTIFLTITDSPTGYLHFDSQEVTRLD